MNKKRSVCVICGAVLAGLLWWFWIGDSSRKTGDDSSYGINQDTQGMPVNASTDELRRYEDKARSLGLSRNRPSKFYGRVLDQNHQPVAGVVVKCKLNYYSMVVKPDLGTWNKEFERITDSDGRFDITDISGWTLYLDIQPKEGYIFEKESLGIMLNDGKAPLSTGNNPYLFNAYKKGVVAHLHYGSFISDTLIPDGRSYVVQLKEKRIREGSTGGDFVVSIKRPAGFMRGKYDWSVEISRDALELQETQDVFMYQAPLSGYQEEWKCEHRATDNGYVKRMDSKIYVKSRDGVLYGRINLRIISDWDESASLTIRYWLNPAGSPNLEYDDALRFRE